MSDSKEKGLMLLSSTSVTMGTNANGSKQILYTVPYGKDCVVTEVIIRNPSGTLAGCNDVDFGVGAACATQAFLNNETGIIDVTATDDFMRLVTSSNDYKVIDGSDTTMANTQFGIQIIAGATAAAATATIDVFGYIF
jgi:hypothetical protein